MRTSLVLLVGLLFATPALADGASCKFVDEAQTIVHCSLANGSEVSGMIDNPEVIGALAPSNGVSVIAPFVRSPADQCDLDAKAGLAITSSTVPEGAGTWSLSAQTQSDIQGVVLGINNLHRFPGNLAQFPWLDLAGTPHLFTTTNNFIAWATAYGDYYTLFQLACDTARAGWSWSPPAQPVSIP